MKIRTADDLLDKIERDLSIRKKDLTYHKLRVVGSSGSEIASAVRSAITMLYAHWEGAIKNYTIYYLCLVSNTGKAYQDLQQCFSVIKMKKMFKSVPSDSKHASVFKNAFNEIGEVYGGQAVVDKDLHINVVNTESNLQYRVFRELLFLVGLGDEDVFSLEQNFIDEVLLGSRNKIAHGDIEAPLNFTVSIKEYCSLHDRVFRLIADYADIILDLALEKKYLKQSLPLMPE